jgi:hypothetical protein
MLALSDAALSEISPVKSGASLPSREFREPVRQEARQEHETRDEQGDER